MSSQIQKVCVKIKKSLDKERMAIETEFQEYLKGPYRSILLSSIKDVTEVIDPFQSCGP